MRMVTVLLLALVSVFATMGVPVAAQTPSATPNPAMVGYGCDELDDYGDAVIELFDSLDDADIEAMVAFYQSEADLDTMRPSELTSIAGAFDRWATLLDDMPEDQIPPVATAFHATVVDLFSVSASILNAMGQGQVFGAMAYSDTLDEVRAELDDHVAFAERSCGDAWTRFHDRVGTLLPIGAYLLNPPPSAHA